MKASTITLILTFTAAALALPTNKPAKAGTYTPYNGKATKTPSRSLLFGKRTTEQAIDDCGSNDNPTLCTTVVNAIVGWDASVNTVNDFLNNAESKTGSDLTSFEQNALNFANLEPGFLATLQSTPGLSQEGVGAANVLGAPGTGVFPQVPANLQTLLDGSGTPVQTAVDKINNVRCAQILGAISTLWEQAALAAGADAPGGALGPFVCQKPGGNVGDAYN